MIWVFANTKNTLCRPKHTELRGCLGMSEDSAVWITKNMWATFCGNVWGIFQYVYTVLYIIYIIHIMWWTKKPPIDCWLKKVLHLLVLFNVFQKKESHSQLQTAHCILSTTTVGHRPPATNLWGEPQQQIAFGIYGASWRFMAILWWGALVLSHIAFRRPSLKVFGDYMYIYTHLLFELDDPVGEFEEWTTTNRFKGWYCNLLEVFGEMCVLTLHIWLKVTLEICQLASLNSRPKPLTGFSHHLEWWFSIVESSQQLASKNCCWS